MVAGSQVTRVAYPYQIAATQSAPSYAAVSDWAMTGATPADWDPAEGVFGPQLKKLKDQYVVMTLGANPLLSDFTNITLAGATIADGPCASSTGYKSGGTWYAGPLSAPVDCVDRQWDKIDQTQHLVNIYEELLREDDHVLVLGYYQGCPWSFGNWQPAGNVLDGPAKGYSCTSQIRPLSTTDHTLVTQWHQALAVGNSVNTHIHDAFLVGAGLGQEAVAGHGPLQGPCLDHPGPGRVGPASAAEHARIVDLHPRHLDPPGQGTAPRSSRTRSPAAMCSSFGRWCGSQRAWG